MMRNSVSISTTNDTEMVDFYVNRLGFFAVDCDLGLGSILLRYVPTKDFFIELTPDLASPVDDVPRFSLAVENCTLEFERLIVAKFLPGTGICEPRTVIEYPVGKYFKLRDPANNVFAVQEWF